MVSLRRQAKLFRLSIALGSTLILFVAGCTTTQTLYSGSGAIPAGILEAGDVVVARLHDGRTVELTVLTWTAERLVGVDRADTQYTLGTEEIAELRVKRYSAVRTGILIGLGAALVAMIQVTSGYAELLGGW